MVSLEGVEVEDAGSHWRVSAVGLLVDAILVDIDVFGLEVSVEEIPECVWAV